MSLNFDSARTIKLAGLFCFVKREQKSDQLHIFVDVLEFDFETRTLKNMTSSKTQNGYNADSCTDVDLKSNVVLAESELHTWCQKTVRPLFKSFH